MGKSMSGRVRKLNTDVFLFLKAEEGGKGIGSWDLLNSQPNSYGLRPSYIVELYDIVELYAEIIFCMLKNSSYNNLMMEPVVTIPNVTMDHVYQEANQCANALAK